MEWFGDTADRAGRHAPRAYNLIAGARAGPFFGSSLSLRSMLRMGSTLSVYGYGYGKLGFSHSVLDFACIGSSLSLRSMLRMGKQLSVYGLVRIGS